MSSRGDIIRAALAGKEAAEQGHHVTACPYPADDLRRTAWVMGYARARPAVPDGQGDE